jgi:hypothetical protein
MLLRSKEQMVDLSKEKDSKDPQRFGLMKLRQSYAALTLPDHR